MSGFEMRDTTGQHRDLKPASDRVRDVADFQSRWAEFRPFATGALRSPALTAQEVDTLGWMIEVMDRIGPRDLERGDEGDCRP
jgi:hypothetical protein